VFAARGGESNRSGTECVGQLPLHRGQVVLGRGFGERALSHDVGAQRRVTDVRGVVNSLRPAIDRIQVFREGLPGPRDAVRERVGVDVLGAFEVADHQFPLVVAHGRKGEPAVAHHGGGHAVPAGVHAGRVPHHLRVEVGVAIDEPGGHDVALGVDLGAAALADAADRGDPVTDDADVGAVCTEARAVHDRAVPDDEVEIHALLASPRVVLRAPKAAR